MKQLGRLKALINRHGVAQVAVWLGYRDTNAIKKWVSRGWIPTIAQQRVGTLLKEVKR